MNKGKKKKERTEAEKRAAVERFGKKAAEAWLKLNA